MKEAKRDGELAADGGRAPARWRWGEAAKRGRLGGMRSRPTTAGACLSGEQGR